MGVRFPLGAPFDYSCTVTAAVECPEPSRGAQFVVANRSWQATKNQHRFDGGFLFTLVFLRILR